MDANLHDLFRICLRQRRKMLGFFATCMVTSGAVILFAPKSYRSEAKLLVRLGRENVVLDSAATLGQSAAVAVPLSREHELNSVVAILKSRAIVEQVVDALGPATILDAGESGLVASEKSPSGSLVQAGATSWLSDLPMVHSLPKREKAVLALLASLRVNTAHKSDVVEVACLSPAPDLAQAVVAKLVEIYVDQHIGWNRTPKAREFFQRQTERLHGDLRRAEAELVALKNETGMASPEDQRKMLVAQMGRLEDDLLSAEASTSAVQAELRKVEEKLAGYPTTEVLSKTTGFATEAADTMRAQLYGLELKQQELLSRHTEDHPEVRLLRDQIVRSRQAMESNDRSLAQVTMGRTRTREQAELSLLEREPQLASHEARAGKLREQLAAARGKLEILNDHERQITELAREVALTEASYRKYSESLEQTRIDEALQAERISNISVVQPATYELKPARPQRLLTLVLGLVIGVSGSLTLALVAERLAPAQATLLSRFESPLRRRVDGKVPA